MQRLVIKGGNKLHGEVEINGAKNSAVAVLPAVLLCDEGICTLENLPDISDIRAITDMLLHLGAKVNVIDKHTVEIDSSTVNNYHATYEKARKMRASYYLLGALLTRFGKAEAPFPGGCNFGARPIDQHIKGFEALGAVVQVEHGIIKAHADKLIGTHIYLDVVSVGATINVMLASVKAEGITVIENAAKEPHIVDLANFLNSMGAQIKGAGTDVIRIKGVDKLRGCTYSIIPDQIEAGTYMIATAAAGGNVLIKNVIPKHLEAVTAKLVEMGIKVEEYEDSIRVIADKRPKKGNVKTLPYPGFPTDFQPQMTVLMSIAEGTSIMTEGVWDNRFQYVDELKKMGINIRVEGRMAVVEGVSSISGAPVKATDLRAAAAFVIAGLVCDGVTEVYNLQYLDRGYEEIESKLCGLGADLKREECED